MGRWGNRPIMWVNRNFYSVSTKRELDVDPWRKMEQSRHEICNIIAADTRVSPRKDSNEPTPFLTSALESRVVTPVLTRSCLACHDFDAVSNTWTCSRMNLTTRRLSRSFRIFQMFMAHRSEVTDSSTIGWS